MIRRPDNLRTCGCRAAPGTTLTRPLTFAQTTVNLVGLVTCTATVSIRSILRFSKIVKVGAGRIDLNVDIYNALQLGCHPHAAERLRCGMDAAVDRDSAALREVRGSLGFLAFDVGRSAYAKRLRRRTGPTRQGESLTTQSHAWVAGLVRQGALSVPTRADSAPDFSLDLPARSKPVS